MEEAMKEIVIDGTVLAMPGGAVAYFKKYAALPSRWVYSVDEAVELFDRFGRDYVVYPCGSEGSDPVKPLDVYVFSDTHEYTDVYVDIYEEVNGLYLAGNPVWRVTLSLDKESGEFSVAYTHSKSEDDWFEEVKSVPTWVLSKYELVRDQAYVMVGGDV
jgi:hypothetical protein